MNSFGFWLLPPEELLQKYNKVISNLSQKYSTPKFEAHISLLPKIEGLEKEEILEKTELALKSFLPIPIEFMGINFSNTFHQCVFAQVKMSVELLNAHNTLGKLLNLSNDQKFFPHLSFIYGDFSSEEKYNISKDLIVPDNFLVDKLVIVDASGPDIHDREHIKEFKL